MTDWDDAQRTVEREDAYAYASTWIGGAGLAVLAASIWGARAFPTQVDWISHAFIAMIVLLMAVKCVWAIGCRPSISLEQYYDLKRQMVLHGYVQRLARVQQHLTLDLGRIVFAYLDESDAEMHQLQQAETDARETARQTKEFVYF